MLTASTGASTTAAIKKAFFNVQFPEARFRPLLCGIEAILSIQFSTPAPNPGPWYRVGSQKDVVARVLVMEALHSITVMSPVGPLFLAASGRGLVALEFDTRLPGQQTIRPNPRDLRTEAGSVQFTESAAALTQYTRELQEYFAGQRRQFSFPLDMRGTDFQIACWNALLAIPYGETRTYADIARAVGRPQGFRAVGMANNRNPIAIVVPCHRVIASDGTLCGYGGGLDVKRKLLELEGALSGALVA
jgi:O-6-methylguanine DNA methyltransferase